MRDVDVTDETMRTQQRHVTAGDVSSASHHVYISSRSIGRSMGDL